MPTFSPKYTLYEDDGITLIYQFQCVQDDQGAFTDPASYSEHSSLRGIGSIISPGSDQAFDLAISFVLTGDDYQDLVAQMDDLLTTIPKFVNMVLKIDLTPSTTKDYYVERIQSFQWIAGQPLNRVHVQKGVCTLRVKVWEP